MSSTLTIGGGNSSTGGIVGIPSTFPTAMNSLLQTYLDGVADSVNSGAIDFENNDVVGNNFSSVAGSVVGAGGLQEITNTDSTGAVTAGSVSGSFSVSAGTGTLIVQAPGAETVTGNGITSVATFGNLSNVDYSDVDGGSPGLADSIFAAGGSDSITTFSTTNTGSSYNIFSAGKDTINLHNTGTDSVEATGNATTTVFVDESNATVTATDGSHVSVQFTQGAGGNVDFINNSSFAATIFSGNYIGGAAPNSVTAFGGAGGGYFVGGKAGNNSLIGGTGVATLQGANSGDFLESNSSSGTNILFAGAGNETLIGSATSGSNTFQVGLAYTGATGDIISDAVVSTEGSGTQAFILGSSANSTLTGSSAAGASNIYDFIRDAASQANGAANYTITDFTSKDSLFITDSTQAAGHVGIATIGTALGSSNAEIVLGDGTTITLTGVSASSLSFSTFNTGIVSVSKS